MILDKVCALAASSFDAFETELMTKALTSTIDETKSDEDDIVNDSVEVQGNDQTKLGRNGTMEENNCLVTVTDPNSNKKKMSTAGTLEMEEVENAFIDENFVFITLPKTRGRPKQGKTRAIGLPTVPKVQVYEKKNRVLQARMLLKYLINADWIDNIIEGASSITRENLNVINKNNLKDIFIDDKVDVDVLQYYLDKKALSYLRRVIERKDKDYFSCNLCSNEAKEGVVHCHSCPHWYHFFCVDVEPSDVADENVPWFCDDCLD